MEKDENSRYLGQMDKEEGYEFGVSGGIAGHRRGVGIQIYAVHCSALLNHSEGMMN